MLLLTRDTFRTEVFKRDRGQCVVCKQQPAVDAHHLIDRSLWGDSGGYYLNNGVSLCATHHYAAETTTLSCDELREAAGITEVVLPDHFYSDEKYDHWGNIILPSGMRIKGELFGEDRVQKVLKEANLFGVFLKYVKYPRTYHCAWSPNLQNDDRQHEDVSFFIGKEVVVTAKLDGENTSLYPDYIHARSTDSKHHESRSWVKALHGRIAQDIPEGFRICGENMYATHSIHYEDLEDYFYVFNIWDDKNIAIPWDDTILYAGVLGLKVVPVLCRFVWESQDSARALIDESMERYKKTTKDDLEGYVIRVTGSIPYKDYRRSTAKVVRKGHVQTDEFWMNKPVVLNKLKRYKS